MFLLKIIFQNSVSTCIKNICPLSILLLVSICIWWNRKFVVQSAGTEKKNCHTLRSVTHYRCDVPGGVGAWHITWFALARMIWHSKNFLPHFARPIFFSVPALCTTNFLFHQNLFRGMSGYSRCPAEELNQI